jgi:hypothetical protein
MSSAGAALCAAVSVSGARAEASRRNGALSRGPRTAEGRARSAQNALKHGLRAEKHVVLPDGKRWGGRPPTASTCQGAVSKEPQRGSVHERG